jgi:AcrR family transcriptional regulator
MTAPTPAGGGLRERKKARTRAAIQEHALRLFDRQGYQATTTEEIAAAAEISVSTLFRYFPTKEDIVLYDAWDPRLVEVLVAQPAELAPIAAIRAAVRDTLGQINADENELEQIRQRLVFSVPELRGRMFDQFASTIGMLAEGLATRRGRPGDDPEARILAGAVVGAMLATFQFGPDAAEQLAREDFRDRIDQALAYLEAGLPL